MTPFWAGFATGLAILFAKSPVRACLSVIVLLFILLALLAIVVAMLVAVWQVTLSMVALIVLAFVIRSRMRTARARRAG